MWEFLGFPERLGRINDVLYVPEVAVEFWWFLSAGDFSPYLQTRGFWWMVPEM